MLRIQIDIQSVFLASCCQVKGRVRIIKKIILIPFLIRCEGERYVFGLLTVRVKKVKESEILVIVSDVLSDLSGIAFEGFGNCVENDTVQLSTDQLSSIRNRTGHPISLSPRARQSKGSE